MRSVAFSLALVFLFSQMCLAEEATHLYSPDPCEFSIEFPSEPYTSKRCDDDKKCYEQTSYTQVFENLSSTVNFRVMCNPIDEKISKSYDETVMTATLKAMTKRSVVETFDVSYREEDGYRQAGLVGEGKSGKLSTLYIAQLWIGKKSAFSVEAELIGSAAPEPDKLFSDILKSAKFKEVKGAEKKPEPEEKK